VNIKGAIFDLDGTIIDSMPMWYSLYGNYLAEAHIEPTEELLDFLRHASIPVAAKRFSEGVIPRTAEEIEAELVSYVFEKLGAWFTGTSDVEADWDAYLANLEKIGLSRYLELSQEGWKK